MKQIGFLEKIATLFEFKTVNDKYGNEFVLFANNTINDIDFVEDKTAFESSENHIHIINNIKKRILNL